MQVSRNQLIAAIAGVVVLVGAASYNGRPAPPPPPRPEIAPLPLGNIQGASPELQRAATGMAISSMIFTFLHETGHMLVTELKLPVTGPQEDVADEFATFVLVEGLKAAPEEAKSNIADIIYAGALDWKLGAEERMRGGGKIPWYDEHSPDERRFYNILCVATAADPLRFIARAVKDGVPQARIEKCAYEYKAKNAAWNELMKPHEPGLGSRLFGRHKLTLEYGPVGQAEWGAIENIYRQGMIFQPMLDAVSTAVKLPDDIKVITRGCGQVNAWWSPQDKTITLCHDLFQHELELFAKALMAADQKAQGGGLAVPPPADDPLSPVGGGVPPAALAGVWTCQLELNGTLVQERMALNPNGTFRTQATGTGISMSWWGRWTVQGNALRVDYDGPPGMQSPELIPFQLLQPTVMQQPHGTCRKTGAP